MNHNSTKVWVFLCLTCIAFLVLGFLLGDRWGLFLGLLLSIGFNFLIFSFGERYIINLLGAQPLKGQDPWGANDLIAEISQKIQILPPNLYIITHPSATAFSIGFTRERQNLCITTGFLSRFTKEDLRAVITHQLVQMLRMDSFAFGVTSVVAHSLMGLAQVLDQFWPPNLLSENKRQPFLTLFAPIGWVIVRAAVSEKTFFENDQTAAELLQNRNLLGEVIWRLHGLAATQPFPVPPCTSHLFIVNPEGYSQRNPFLKMHPTIERRLGALLGYYPI